MFKVWGKLTSKSVEKSLVLPLVVFTMKFLFKNSRLSRRFFVSFNPLFFVILYLLKFGFSTFYTGINKYNEVYKKI